MFSVQRLHSNGHIKARTVRNDGGGCHQVAEFVLPILAKCRRIGNGVGIDSMDLSIEGVKGRKGINQLKSL